MRNIRNFAVAGCAVFLLCQCATQDEVRDLSYQIRAVNKKVEEVKGTTVDQMQKRQASSVNKIDTFNDDLMKIQSAIEENGFQNSKFREKTKEDIAGLQNRIMQLQSENEQRIALLNDKFNQLSGNLTQMRQAKIQDAEKRARDAARRAEEARRKTVVAAATPTASSPIVNIYPDSKKVKVEASNGSSAAPVTRPAPVVSAQHESSQQRPAAAPVTSNTPVDLFSNALNNFKKRHYKEAYRDFEQVLSGNPHGDKAAETLFYMGESLFNQGEYDLAILDYQKVISNHPAHKRTPGALMKQGMSFEKLTDLETAKIIYKKLASDHPSSVEAQKAKKRLESL